MMITLKTLPQATAQEVFDQVVRHLLTQNARSTDGSVCMYRDVEGRKCAAGCLIADDEYQEAFEGDRWTELSESRHTPIPLAHATLIRLLQDVHDHIPVEDWPRALRKVADMLGLIMPEL